MKWLVDPSDDPILPCASTSSSSDDNDDDDEVAAQRRRLLLHPQTVVVSAGECLYLPCLWYHRVETVGETVSIAVNYWYDMDFGGTAYLFDEFVGRVMEEEERRKAEGKSLKTDYDKKQQRATNRAATTAGVMG